MKNLIKQMKNGCQRFLIGTGLILTSTMSFAVNPEGLDPAKSAADWVTDFVINITLTLMVLVIIMKLLQVQFAQREWREVFTPILIASLVVGAKVAAPAIHSAMGALA